MEEYVEEVEDVMEEENFGVSYDHELAGKEEAYNDGVKEGIKEGVINTAKEMIKDKVDISTIIKYTKLTKEEIEELR